MEVLLRNPKHSQLLYRPNRSGETPYNIDISQQKTILGQIFGARNHHFLSYSVAKENIWEKTLSISGRLNTNEDNENMLGYELYSSALADMLSEPSLSMPITVGLYAKWGSGKSFLLSKLRGSVHSISFFIASRWPNSSSCFIFSRYRWNERIRSPVDRTAIAILGDFTTCGVACRHTIWRYIGRFAWLVDCWSSIWWRKSIRHRHIPVHSLLGHGKVLFFFFKFIYLR